jgi:hypothetical protein
VKKSLLCVVIAVIFGLSSEALAVRLGSFEVHPFLSLTEQYTDNVYNTNSDKKSDLSTTISTGLQLIFPRVKKKYHLDLIYQMDMERFNKFTSENATNHTANGKFEIKFPGGIQIELSDKFLRGHDPRGVSLSEELDFYTYNTGTVRAAYSLTDRFKLQMDYTNLFINYDAERNRFRNRTDNTVAGYLYYRILPKTAVFVEYEYVAVNFKESEDSDSTEHHIFGGITWEVTGKTKGTFKGGYGTKSFKDQSLEKFSGYLVEATVDYNFTSRHSVKLKGIRETNETDFYGSDFYVSTVFSLEYFQRFTGKITAKCDLSYGVDNYYGDVKRRDDEWKTGIGIIYEIKKWLITEAGYYYTKRNSDIEDFSYKNNLFKFKVTTRL